MKINRTANVERLVTSNRNPVPARLVSRRIRLARLLSNRLGRGVLSEAPEEPFCEALLSFWPGDTVT
jgi:hypothetical protein